MITSKSDLRNLSKLTKSSNEPNIVLAGIPARKISDKGMNSGRKKV